jgi:hypothetical protein
LERKKGAMSLRKNKDKTAKVAQISAYNRSIIMLLSFKNSAN